MSDSSQQRGLANEMSARVPTPRLDSEFNAFLFSPIGDDRNGMPLSVVSLLARRDLDPWQEAGSLAAMPVNVAIRRLESLIRALPDQPLTLPDSRTIATRLIALLPHPTDSGIRPLAKQANTSDAAALAPGRRTVVVAMVIVIYMILLIGIQLATLRNKPPMQHVAADAAPAPITSSQSHPPSEK